MPRREIKLIRASNMLSKYFGLTTVKDLLARTELEKVTTPNILDISNNDLSNVSSGNSNGNINSDISEAKRALLSLIVDTTEGARTTIDIIRNIRNNILAESNELNKELLIELGRLTQIHYNGGEENFAVGREESNSIISHLSDNLAKLGINEIMNNVDHTFINSSPGNPNKDKPGLSVILSNSPRVSLQQRFVNPIVLFLNAIPNIELQRAVPYASVEFIIDRQPISKDGRLQALSLPKFLLGAAKAEPSNTALHGMANAISTRESPLTPDDLQEKTIAGMELFTSPQTLVNADQFDVPNSVRANPVLDKFRPFMSLTEINITVVPSTGIMSFKTARMSFVVHDRSRLNEIAEFIRPDFYSRNEISIEYGWSHPDGERENNNNPYGDLINALRVKEKFMIRNSSFSLDDAGQVIVNLDLAMRGGTDFDTELISSNETTFGETIREIRELEETIADLRTKVFPDGTIAKQKEIRGVQVLNAAQDARNHLTFTEEFKEELNKLRKDLRKSDGNPNVKSLLGAIDKLYGREIKLRKENNRGNLRSYQAAQNSQVAQLRRALAEEITQKIREINAGKDPFLVPKSETESKLGINGRQRVAPRSRDEDQQERFEEFAKTQFGVDVATGKSTSLAKLLLHFIGEPLAATKKYDDVQMIFYPFNRNAGAARRLNIGNFVVDLSYFADEFARYRLNHIGKSGNMSLRDFMSFLQDILIDDPAAPSYGLDGLFETVVSSDGTYLDTRSKFEAPDYQTRMEERLLEYGISGGEFKMPQIDFYVEALPERVPDEEGIDPEASNERTILRIHILDRLATSYESVGSILSATRDSKISTIGNALRSAETSEGNSGVVYYQGEEYASAIQLARDKNLISITNRNSKDEDLGPDSTIRFIGRNNESLKQFIMHTMPYMIYGAGATAIKNANLASMQDPKLSTVHMLRSFRKREQVRPNGEQPGGLPMRVIPTQLTMQTFGCPLISFAQQFFVDFQTGTTADNIYAVVGLDHKITAGEFNSEIKFVPLDSYGKYESLIGRINSVEAEVSNIQKESDDESGIGN